LKIRGFDSFTINDRLTLHLNPDALPRKVNCAAKVSQAVRSDIPFINSRMLARRSINHAMLTAFINRLICTESYVAVLAMRQSDSWRSPKNRTSNLRGASPTLKARAQADKDVHKELSEHQPAGKAWR